MVIGLIPVIVVFKFSVEEMTSRPGGFYTYQRTHFSADFPVLDVENLLAHP
jgi:hypothetical protein